MTNAVRVEYPDALNVDFLLEGIVCDLHLGAVEIGSVTMLLAACARGDDKASPQSCVRLVMDDSKAMLLALRYARELRLGGELSHQLGQFYGRMIEEKRRLAPLTRSFATQNATVRTAYNGWLDLARQAAAVAKLFHKTQGSRLEAMYAEDHRAIQVFLARAIEGDAGLIEETGQVRVPHLRQRRRTPRVEIQQDCTVILPTGSYPARMENASRTGLGLACDQILGEQQTVTIRLADRRELAATVVRRNGRQYGLALRHPLSALDPLLVGV